MNVTLTLGIVLLAYALYSVARRLAQKTARLTAYQHELHDLLTNEKYQVKGRFE